MTTSDTPRPALLWDVFCRVVDNFGDIGVCWRLATHLAARGQRIRLWVDDASALQWMAPGAQEGRHEGIQVLPWTQSQQADLAAQLPLADVWIEAFGCEIAPEFIAAYAHFQRPQAGNRIRIPTWINLEYLTAERYAERCHTLPSPLMSGPAAGWSKHFFYPGFTPLTGGLLRESDLVQRQHAFNKADWLAQQGIAWHGERLVSLFCYEPPALAEFLQQLALDATPTRLLVTPGRASAVVKHWEQALPPTQPQGSLSIAYLPALTQADFDHLLWACDINCVRGEDSLVRALWAGKPLVWQIYPQDDNAHHDKLEAFLDFLGANASLRQLHHAWNGVGQTRAPSMLSPLEFDAWQEIVQTARARLAQADDLATQLIAFVLKKR